VLFPEDVKLLFRAPAPACLLSKLSENNLSVQFC